MSPTAIIFLAAAAVLHAGWNLLSKRNHPTASYFLLTSLAGGLLFAPTFLLFPQALPGDIPAGVWTLLGGAGFSMALYYVSLAAAYRAGDMSVAYPLARSSPILVVTATTVLLGRGGQVGAACVGGIILVVAGCFLIPLRRFGCLHFRNYINTTCVCALLSAIGTAGYSLCDDEALRRLRVLAGADAQATGIALNYACLEGFVTALWLGFFIFARREGRRVFAKTLRESKRNALVTGFAIFITYAFVLIAMGHVANVSYVVAFRQLSIPLGVLFGIGFLKEPAHAPKLAGVAVMLSGLLLVALG